MTPLQKGSYTSISMTIFCRLYWRLHLSVSGERFEGYIGILGRLDDI